MPHPSRAILQIDFDGTLVEGDASTGILARFAGPEWTERVNAASRVLHDRPDSPALIDAMTAGYALLGDDFEAYIAHVRQYHPPRPGLRGLIDTATRLGIEPHVVSNGFEFYIRDHLRTAGVEDRVAIHTGSAQDGAGALFYAGPDGAPVHARFKERWTHHFKQRAGTVIYIGDGTSDIAAAILCDAVFARDGLLTGLQNTAYRGELRAFETLHDVARMLKRDYSSMGSK
jgi:HAD superfamily phosphoserine phosphatase-like hydrolase